MSWQRWGVSASMALLVACGGGGDDAEPVPTPPPPPEPVQTAGLWAGSSSTGYDFQLLTTEEGEMWGLGQFPLTLDPLLLHGTYVLDTKEKAGDTFLFSGREYARDGNVGVFAGSAVIASESTLTATISQPPVRVNTVFDPRFYQGSAFGTVEGTWEAATLNAEGERSIYGLISISRFGAISGIGLAGDATCNFSGNIIPVSGRGYYSVALTFSGSRGCRMPGQTVNGIALVSGTGQNAQLSMGAITADGWQGVSAVFLPPLPPEPEPEPEAR